MKSLPNCKLCNNTRHIRVDGVVQRCDCVKGVLFNRMAELAGIPPVMRASWQDFKSELPSQVVDKLPEFAKSVVPTLRSKRYRVLWLHDKHGGPYIVKAIGCRLLLDALECRTELSTVYSTNIDVMLDRQFEENKAEYNASVYECGMLHLYATVMRKHKWLGGLLTGVCERRMNSGLVTIVTSTDDLRKKTALYGPETTRFFNDAKLVRRIAILKGSRSE